MRGSEIERNTPLEALAKEREENETPQEDSEEESSEKESSDEKSSEPNWSGEPTSEEETQGGEEDAASGEEATTVDSPRSFLEIDPLLENLHTIEDLGLNAKLAQFIGIRPEFLYLLVDIIKASWSDVHQFSRLSRMSDCGLYLLHTTYSPLLNHLTSDLLPTTHYPQQQELQRRRPR